MAAIRARTKHKPAFSTRTQINSQCEVPLDAIWTEAPLASWRPALVQTTISARGQLEIVVLTGRTHQVEQTRNTRHKRARGAARQ